MPRSRKYPEELVERGVRLALESWRPVTQVARDLGIDPEELRKRVRQAGADAGERTDLDDAGACGDPRAAQGELRAAACERDLEVCVAVFRARARHRPTEVSAFIDQRRVGFGVEPICRTLGVSASAYYQRASGERSARTVEDEPLLEVIRVTHKKNYEAYGYRRVWKALLRMGERVPRCRVQRLMAEQGIQGAKRRGKRWRTTKADPGALRRPDLVRRDFTAGRPNALWVADSRSCAAGRASCTSAS